MIDAIKEATKKLSHDLNKKLDEGFTEELVDLFKRGVLKWQVIHENSTKLDSGGAKLTASVKYRISFCGKDKIEELEDQVANLDKLAKTAGELTVTAHELVLSADEMLVKAVKIINCPNPHQFLKHDVACKQCGFIKKEWRVKR